MRDNVDDDDDDDDDDVAEEEDVEEEDRSQDGDPHFVCAVETHVKISQKPLYAKNNRKNAAAQIEPQNADTHTHTRLEWIIIWSGRNWILKHAEPGNRTIR